MAPLQLRAVRVSLLPRPAGPAAHASAAVTVLPSSRRGWAATGHCRRRRRPQASGAEEAGDEAEGVDIDELARKLAAEAEKLRQRGGSMDEADAAAEKPPAGAAAGGSPVFGIEARLNENDVLARIGPGGFVPEEFELLQQLGTINIQQVTASIDLNDSPLPTSERSARTAVIAYTASFFSGMPFQDPVVTLVKEYLPGAKAVACNELQVLQHLCAMPELSMKWQVAAGPLAQNPPIVRLLGYFVAGQTQGAQELLEGGEEPEDAIWVVLKWENLAPLALYPRAQQTSGIGLGRLFGAQDASMKDRSRMLRAITRGALEALAYCHEAGVVHGALGSGSVMLSTFDDRSAARLAVKLDNFGFARITTGGRSAGSAAGGQQQGGAQALSPQPATQIADDTPLALGQKEDLRALAVVLLECFLSALSAGGPLQGTSAESIQRLLGDVFSWGMEEFQSYCQDEPDWQAAVALLSADEGAGWDLLRRLVSGSGSAAELAGSRFCQF